VADLNAALLEKFLDVSVIEGEAVVQLLWACWMIVIEKR